MKKRDRPLVGDSPARIRVPMVGTVSLGGVVAVANGRCGIPESSPGRPLCKAVCGASPRNQVRGRLRRASGTGPTPTGVEEKTCATRVGLGEEGWKPAGERAEEATPPVRGAAWWNGARVQAVARRRRPGVQAGHWSAPFASRVVNRCLRYASAGPLSGQGRGQVFAKGRSPRRLRSETTLPGRHRIPRTAATSSVPPFPAGTRAAACPAPWL